MMVESNSDTLLRVLMYHRQRERGYWLLIISLFPLWIITWRFDDYFVETCYERSNICCIYSELVHGLCQMASVGTWSHNEDFSAECAKWLSDHSYVFDEMCTWIMKHRSYVLSGHTTKRRIPNSVQYHPIILMYWFEMYFCVMYVPTSLNYDMIPRC